MENIALRKLVKFLLAHSNISEKDLNDIMGDVGVNPFGEAQFSERVKEVANKFCDKFEVVFPMGADDFLIERARKVEGTDSHLPCVAMDLSFYDAVGNTDMNEYKGAAKSFGKFKDSQHEEALAFAKSKGLYENDVKFKTKSVVFADGKLFLIGEEVVFTDSKAEEAEMRAAALAKLTPKEKALLGLK